MQLMSHLVLISLFATCAATTVAFAGAFVGPPIAAPEPSSLALLASGVGIVYVVRKLRRRK
jgi:hypothetical protein